VEEGEPKGGHEREEGCTISYQEVILHNLEKKNELDSPRRPRVGKNVSPSKESRKEEATTYYPIPTSEETI